MAKVVRTYFNLIITAKPKIIIIKIKSIVTGIKDYYKEILFMAIKAA